MAIEETTCVHVPLTYHLAGCNMLYRCWLGVDRLRKLTILAKWRSPDPRRLDMTCTLVIVSGLEMGLGVVFNSE